MKPKLKVFPALDGKCSVGWQRDDLPMVHVFAHAKPGEAFQPSDGHGGPHWPCPVCEAHGYTKEDFHREMIELMKRGMN